MAVVAMTALSSALACLTFPIRPAAAQELSLDDQLSGNMLPRGRHAVRVELRHGESSQAYNELGEEEPLLADLDNVNLSASYIPLLSLLGAGASLGTTDIQAELSGERIRLTYGYGLSEDLTAGLILGWGRLRNHVGFNVSGGNLANNPFYNPALPIGPANPPFVPLGALGTTVPVDTEDVQDILTNPAYGYNYRRLAPVTTQGFLDPVLGLRWRVAHGPGWSTILSPSLRLGLAEADDPDDLMDVRLEDGSDDLMLGLEHYRALAAGWEMRAQVQYTWQLPDHRRMRPYAAGGLGLVSQASSERLERDLGDVLQVELEAARRFGDWRLAGRLEYSRDSADAYASPSGQDVTGLEANTAGWASNLWIGASWSGIRRYLDTGRGLPAIVSLQYRIFLDGRNVIKSDNLFLTATLPF